LSFVRRLAPLLSLLLLTAFAAAGCGDDDEQDAAATPADLLASLPTANELGHQPFREDEWDSATDMLVQGIVIPEDTSLEDLAAELEDAGFQAAAGAEFENPDEDRNVRIAVAEFDSSEGATAARDRLHEEDLKQPCATKFCLVTPVEYELDGIPDSAAAHHLPTEGELPPDVRPVEAFHAGFVVDTRLYLIQTDGAPDPALESRFGRDIEALYDSASAN
jgi:hypothetical protein